MINHYKDKMLKTVRLLTPHSVCAILIIHIYSREVKNCKKIASKSNLHLGHVMRKSCFSIYVCKAKVQISGTVPVQLINCAFIFSVYMVSEFLLSR